MGSQKVTPLANWQVSDTAHHIRRLVEFDRLLQLPISAKPDCDHWTAYVDGTPRQYGYMTYRAALRGADRYRWNAAEPLRPEGWRFRKTYAIEVNACDVWTPDLATNLLPQSRDGDGGREGELSWS